MRLKGLLTVLLFVFSTSVFAGEYIIGGGDSLNISVWGSPELSLISTVRPDGKISVPALGEIAAAGLTPMELTKLLEKEMTKMVKNPMVTVVLEKITNFKVYIFGRGVLPQEISLSSETTLLQLMSRLGSLSDADLEKAYLARGGKVIKTGFHELLEKGDFSQDFVVQPEDVIFIPDNFKKRISVVGAVKQETTLPYREGLTILDVLLAVGGFNEFAKQSDVLVLRKKDAGNIVSDLVVTEERVELFINAKELMKGDLRKNILITPGDIIVVRESIF
ncbi:MAG: polysaccharide biosynthesis/export family protein [Nitrospira sp.]|nr:polysaccharide biosynthesis/export family protein [Nitrospira sp.]